MAGPKTPWGARVRRQDEDRRLRKREPRELIAICKKVEPTSVDLDALRLKYGAKRRETFFKDTLLPAIDGLQDTDPMLAKQLALQATNTYPVSRDLWAAYIDCFDTAHIEQAINQTEKGPKRKSVDYVHAAKFLVHRNRPAAAIVLLETAIGAIGPKPDISSQLTSLYLKDSQIGAAIESISNALVKFPDDPVLNRQFANIAMSQADFTQAIKASRRALKADPDNLKSRTVLGHALLRDGQIPLAVQNLKTVTDTAPDDVIGRYLLASSLLGAGKAKEARSHIHKILEQKFDALAMRIYKGIALSMGEREMNTYDMLLERAANSESHVSEQVIAKLKITNDERAASSQPADLLERLMNDIPLPTHSGKLLGGEYYYTPASKADARGSSSSGDGHHAWAEEIIARKTNRPPVPVKPSVGRH